jgi:hypothetical protein
LEQFEFQLQAAFPPISDLQPWISPCDNAAMHFLTLILAAPLLFQGVFAQTLETDILAAKALFNLATYTAQHGYPSGSCTLQNVAIRREWYVGTIIKCRFPENRLN